MSTKLDYLSKYGGSASTTDYLGGGGGGPKKSKKSKKSKSKKSKKAPSRLAESSLMDHDDLRPFLPDRGEDDDEDECAGPDDGPTVVDGAAVAPSRPAAPGVNRRPGGSGGFTKVRSLGTGGGAGGRTGGRERHDSSDEGEGGGKNTRRRGARHDSSSDEEQPRGGRRRHDSSDDSSDGGGRARNGRARRHDTDSEDDAGRSGGGRRRHDSPDDGSAAGGEARRKRARRRRGSSSEDGGGGRRPSGGRGGRNGRHDSSEEEDGRGRRRSDSDGSRKKKRRRRRRDSDSGDDVRRAERRRHDSSDEDDDDGSDSVDAAGRAKRMSSGHRSGLQDAGDFAAAERKLRKRQRRELERYNAKNGGDGRTVYRDKSGRKREVDPAADEAELARAEREREERQVRSNKGARQRELEELEAAELAAASSMTVARGIDDRNLEAQKKAEIRPDDPMAAHAWKKREEESAGTDSGQAAARPTYKGPQAKPNRYGLRPGYRWDGIERGNGFEDRVLETLHSRGHKREEAYRWSSADM